MISRRRKPLALTFKLKSLMLFLDMIKPKQDPGRIIPEPQISTQVLVKSAKMKPFDFGDAPTETWDPQGEAIEFTAYGTWTDEEGIEYPIKIHLTVPMGSPIEPRIGDELEIKISPVV